ncbi:hypothetical protein OGAPHI_000595 [Ogataea philodendri]|uniref:Bola-like protein n=1 Tax=Ogataea philodendri TaxID=1378263 RepID=A0A9P8PG87_9ASCO|nr:uncharacterized protein OGAPHI_000595 [Ogataea philodendri]KAH3670884.1 hypothetical protein OGAPHI_000595 [Ogataea philodendri]
MFRSVLSRRLAPGFGSGGYGARLFSDGMDAYETMVYNKLKEALDPSSLSVRDISDGCGSMFAINVESAKFKGLSMIKQHRLVNELLKDEIANWHGLQLKTKAQK